MKKKTLFSAEIAGTAIVIFAVIFLWSVYELTGKSTISVVFGAVNSSVWEMAKGISIAWFLFGIAELLCIRPVFRNFTVAKTCGLCVSLSTFLILKIFLDGDFTTDIIILCVSVFLGFFCSCFLIASGFNLSSFFALSCFFLMLIFMMTISFTAYPPRMLIFKDPYTGCYGIIPQSFDLGAVVLSS